MEKIPSVTTKTELIPSVENDVVYGSTDNITDSKQTRLGVSLKNLAENTVEDKDELSVEKILSVTTKTELKTSVENDDEHGSTETNTDRSEEALPSVASDELAQCVDIYNI